jgi:hypothetical protein
VPTKAVNSFLPQIEVPQIEVLQAVACSVLLFNLNNTKIGTLFVEKFDIGLQDVSFTKMARGTLAVKPSRKRSINDLDIEERMVKIQQLQLKMLQDVTNQYTALCDPNTLIDERAKLLLKDWLLNFVVRSQPALATAPPILMICDVSGYKSARPSTMNRRGQGKAKARPRQRQGPPASRGCNP